MGEVTTRKIHSEEEELAIEAAASAFLRRVGQVHPDELTALGVELDALGGWFSRRARVEEICQQFPEFHVYSSNGTDFYNRPVDDATAYYLGRGDRDPTLTAPLPQPSQLGWTRDLKRFIEIVGSNPTDPEDIFELNLLRILAGGADFRDAGIIRQARKRQDH